jgi:hypothetical protein
MERTPQIRVFGSFKESDEADRAYYWSLTPAERLDILFELIRRFSEGTGEDDQRLERVHRIVELGKE